MLDIRDLGRRRLAIGLGVLPLVAAIAGLASRRVSSHEREPSDFAIVGVAALVVFAGYTAVKAAYLSTIFAIVIAERNLIYLVPLLFIGTALVLERRVAPSWRSSRRPRARAVPCTRRRIRSTSIRTTRRTASRSPPSRTGSQVAGRDDRARAHPRRSGSGLALLSAHSFVALARGGLASP